MKALVPVLCTLITAGFGYLTATTAASRSDDWTRYEARHAADSVRIAYLADRVAELQQQRPTQTSRGASSRRPAISRAETEAMTEPVTPQAAALGVLAQADSAARANPATAQLPRAALPARVLRGLTGARP